MDRSGISRRIERIYQKWQQNQLEKVILHSYLFGPLTKETILNIAQFREITLHESGFEARDSHRAEGSKCSKKVCFEPKKTVVR